MLLFIIKLGRKCTKEEYEYIHILIMTAGIRNIDNFLLRCGIKMGSINSNNYGTRFR